MDTKKLIPMIVAHQWGCYFYKRGDLFTLGSNELSPPARKAVCLTLAETCKQKIKLIAEKRMEPNELNFLCGGCDGTNHITLKYHRKHSQSSEVEWIVENLHHFSFFRMIPREYLSDMFYRLSITTFNPEEKIIVQGESGKALFIVISGKVEVVTGKDYNHLAYLGAGGIVGEMSLLTGAPTCASVIAREKTRVLTISSELFREMVLKFPDVQRYFYRLLASRLNTLNTHLMQNDLAEMKGELREWALPDLLQTINMNHKSGILYLDLVEGKTEIHFNSGEIVFCRRGKLEGVELFYSLFSTSAGSFRFVHTLEDEQLSGTPMGDFMFLLMEGAVRADLQNQL